ncbi:MAG: hypothetical protein Q7S20_07455 [Gemmatimonadaceae bacterium]|nr:hypothetical protein [Gemmatimonadaceae bacterium]
MRDRKAPRPRTSLRPEHQRAKFLAPGNPRGFSENLAEPFDSNRYTDDYRANLMKLIKARMKGKKIKLEEPAEESA